MPGISPETRVPVRSDCVMRPVGMPDHLIARDMSLQTETPGQLFGASGRHARVVVMTVTHKEFPIARSVFESVGPTAEVDRLAAYTCAAYVDEPHLPYVLVRAPDRGNLPIAVVIQKWMREFRPQTFLLVGTAGGIWRPADSTHKQWEGPERGDVVVSEFVHYSDYRKVTKEGHLLRHHRLEQPANHLLDQADPLIMSPESWHPWLGSTWDNVDRMPRARQLEIVAGEQIQDDPLEATQQFLMREFDRAGATEMESAGMATALHELRVNATYAPMYLSIRGVSDVIWARGLERALEPADIALAEKFAKGRRWGQGHAGKTAEREAWSPRAAASASAFALGLVQRLVAPAMGPLLGHPPIPSFPLQTVGATA